MKHAIVVATLAMGSFSAPTALAALVDPPQAPTPLPASADPFAAGARVRLRTADLIEIPGVARLEPKSVMGNAVKVDAALGIVTVDAPRDGSASGVERLTLPQAGAAFAGVVIASDDNTIRLRLDGHSVEVTVPKAAIAELSVSAGRIKRTRGQTALRGLGIGVALGLALGMVSGDDHCKRGTKVDFLFGQVDSCALAEELTSGQKAILFAKVLGPLGGIGGLLSGGREEDKWQKVTVPSSKHARVALRPGSHGLALSISF